LKQGAALVTEASDVIAVLEPILGRRIAAPHEEPPLADLEERSPGQLADIHARVVALLGPTPIALDDLVRLADASPAQVRIVLLELELAGRLEHHGGGLVSFL